MEAQITSTAQLPATRAIFRRFKQTSQLPNSLKFRSLSSSTCIKCVRSDIKSNVPSKRMFILGMGYVAQFFAQDFLNDGWDVSGTCTNITKKMELEKKGFHVHVFDAFHPEWEILDIMSGYTHLLVSVPPFENVGDPVLQHDDYLRTRLVGGNLRWLCYLSSTSVYGDSEGAWVDEDYPPKPSNDLAKMRLRAEEGWSKLGHDLGLSTYVFRLGGIYGSGRSAIDTILKKEQLSARQKRRTSRNFTSRIHVADICQALRASISMEFQSKIYNVVDDDPASRAEVFEFAQQLIKTRWPDLVTTNDTPLERTQATGGEKRVSNGRMKKELCVKLLHPSYRSGLQCIIDHMPDPI
ncbi:hypothetical protein RND81_01G177300 [Saponaria officinalis]|uniref:NAD-dependent epimerase/dehydratase domain-containing protein n=1 Tax=Saponaria officinalis TaxID=3572 RepID=A0AAW1NAL3_SAPOF